MQNDVLVGAADVLVGATDCRETPIQPKRGAFRRWDVHEHLEGSVRNVLQCICIMRGHSCIIGRPCAYNLEVKHMAGVPAMNSVARIC